MQVLISLLEFAEHLLPMGRIDDKLLRPAALVACDQRQDSGDHKPERECPAIDFLHRPAEIVEGKSCLPSYAACPGGLPSIGDTRRMRCKCRSPFHKAQ